MSLHAAQPQAVNAYLQEFSADALSSIRQAAVQANTDVASLSIRQIGTALFGRRAVDPGGPSEFDILEPLLNTNTVSYQDSTKIARHLASHSGPEAVVDVAIGDGQSVILKKNMKKRWPRLFARWLIVVGGVS